MTHTTSGKVTLSVASKHRLLLRKIRALSRRRKKSISEQVWELCERGLDQQAGIRGGRKIVALPGADLGRVFSFNRKDFYEDILAGQR
jgi:hypothetical protein